MGKQKTQSHLHQKHVLARINFMYQASVLMAGRENTLSAYYGVLCKRIGQRANQRISPSIKRNMCRRCSLSLQPGVTAGMTTNATVNDNSNIPFANEIAVKKHNNRRKRRRHSRNTKLATEMKPVLNQQVEAAGEHFTNNGLHTQLSRKCLPSEEATFSTAISVAKPTPTTIDQQTHMLIKCVLCGQTRSFSVNSNYHYWLDDPDSISSETILKPKSK